MMKIFVLAIPVIFLNYAFSQAVTADYILSGPVKQSGPVDFSKPDFFQTYLPVDFNASTISDVNTINKIKEKTVYKIELVYSSFKESQKFSQEKLNRKRLEELRRVLPSLFENTAIEWELVKQVENSDKSKAKALFHGFIIYSREMAYEKDGAIVPFTREDEIAYLKSIIDKPLPETDTLNSDAVKGYKLVKVYQKRSKAQYLPRLKRKRDKGIRYAKRSIWRRKKEKLPEPVITYDTIFTDAEKCRLTKDFYSTRGTLPAGSRFDPLSQYSQMEDSIVTMTFNSTDWKHTLVVEDVTGSMYPYILQTLVWRKLHIETTRLDEFAFFNDGDNNPDGPIGRSGGIGFVNSHDVSVVEEQVTEVMSKGSGGMGPENNIEATVTGIEKYGEKLELVILIADNYAPVRDIEIVEKLIEKGIRVDVIVCGGSYSALNVDYLEIARLTGGKVYTIEKTIEGLAEMKNGETVKIGENKFKLKNGKFVLTR